MENVSASSLQNVQRRITTIEALELSLLGFFLWVVITLITMGTSDGNMLNWFILLIVMEGGLLGSWVIYNLYIRIARAGGRAVDVGLWIIATALTASYTFWAWTILDMNRWLMKKFFYRGEAPVEYAWSARSKAVRKAWEEARKLQ